MDLKLKTFQSRDYIRGPVGVVYGGPAAMSRASATGVGLTTGPGYGRPMAYGPTYGHGHHYGHHYGHSISHSSGHWGSSSPGIGFVGGDSGYGFGGGCDSGFGGGGGGGFESSGGGGGCDFGGGGGGGD